MAVLIAHISLSFSLFLIFHVKGQCKLRATFKSNCNSLKVCERLILRIYILWLYALKMAAFLLCLAHLKWSYDVLRRYSKCIGEISVRLIHEFCSSSHIKETWLSFAIYDANKKKEEEEKKTIATNNVTIHCVPVIICQRLNESTANHPVRLEYETLLKCALLSIMLRCIFSYGLSDLSIFCMQL